MLVVLTIDVSFTDLDNNPINIQEGTMVSLDHESDIAIYGDHCFILEKGEYAVLN